MKLLSFRESMKGFFLAPPPVAQLNIFLMKVLCDNYPVFIVYSQLLDLAHPLVH